MKLRYRLFLWVGALFVVAFAASFFVEEKVTRTNLEKTRRELLHELYEDNEHKREAIENYIADMLWRIQARVDAVLQGVAKYPLIEQGFRPTIENFQNKTWLSAASLMITNQWVGFIQNTSDEGLLSELIIHSDCLKDTYHFQVDSKIHLVALRDRNDPRKWNGPYVGIPLELFTGQGTEVHPPFREKKDSYYVFFKPETLLQFQAPEMSGLSLGLSVNLLEPFLKWIRVPSKVFFLEPFMKHIEDAKSVPD